MIRVLRKRDFLPAGEFPVVVLRREPQEPFDLHAHEFSELVLITGGKGTHVTGGETLPLAAGDVFVIRGSRPHTYRDMADLRLINILFDPRRLQLRLADLPTLPGYHALFSLEPNWRRRGAFNNRLRLAPADLEAAVNLVGRLEEELRSRAPGFAFLATAIFMQLIGHLSRCYARSRNPDSRSLLRVAQAISHLESRPHEPVNLNALAKIARMSVRSFCRAFGAAMGCSPIRYLIQLRIKQAAQLLRQTDQSVTEIAFAVGFADSNYFTRQFHKQMGSTPRAYRRS